MVSQARFTDGVVNIAGKTVALRRGQFSHSVRFMAEAWNWDKAAVSRFVARLKTETMIETDTETGQLVITICNYERYQADARSPETAGDTAGDTPARQQRDSSETKKKDDESTLRTETKVSVARKRAVPKTRIPSEAVISERMRAAAVERGLSDAEAEAQFAKFRDWAIAKGQTYADWGRAWSNWLTSPYFAPVLGAVHHFPNRRQTYGERVDEAFAAAAAVASQQPF
jgi:hypothetical protein